MTTISRDWLPASALGGPAVLSKIDDAIQGWSTRWAGAGALRRVKAVVRARGYRSVGKSDRWHHLGGGIFLVWSGEISLAFARLCLDIPLDRGIEGKTDRRLLGTLSDKIVADLATLLRERLDQKGNVTDPDEPGRDDPFDQQGGLELTLKGDASLTISLAISADALVRARKVAIGTTHARIDKRNDLVSALGKEFLSYRGRLGRAEMSISDLLGLAKGDVVVLDRKIADGIDLLSCAQLKAFGRARINLDADGGRARATMLAQWGNT